MRKKNLWCVMLVCIALAPFQIISDQKTELAKIKYPSVFELNADDIAWIESTMSEMSVDEKCAQLIMPAVYREHLDTFSAKFNEISSLIKEQKFGGIILYQGGLKEQFNFINKMQSISDIPLLISSDFERGLGSRIDDATEFPHAMALGSTHNIDFAYQMGSAISVECEQLGVNWNFAPVADINNNPSNPVINIRSFSENKAAVSEFVKAFILGSKNHKVITTAKHFPGHGNTELDSHYDLPKIVGEKKYLKINELEPFQEAINAGVQSIMIGHLEVPSLELIPGTPASLSKSIITYLLKDEMGFDGLIITDAMIMEGVTKYYSNEEATVLAVDAGNDIILSPPDAKLSVESLVEAVKNGRISEERINKSVRKILAAKRWLKLIGTDKKSDLDLNVFNNEEHKNLAKKIAEESITILKNKNNIIPLRYQNYKNIYSITVTDGSGGERAAVFQNKLEKRIPGVTSKLFTKTTKRVEYNLMIAELKNADLIILPTFIDVKTYTGPIDLSVEQTDFITAVLKLNIPTILISFKNPYLAYLFSNAPVIFNTYSHSIVSQEATLKALLGEISIKGKLPITIPQTQFAYGYGIEIEKSASTVLDFTTEQKYFPLIDNSISETINSKIFSGAVICAGSNGKILINKPFGTKGFNKNSALINQNEIFEIDESSTSLAILISLIKLNEDRIINPDDFVYNYIDDFYSFDKKDITIKDLLTHYSGFGNNIPNFYYKMSKDELLKAISFMPLENEASTKQKYTVINNIVLHLIIEKLAGKTPGEIFYEAVINKMKLNSAMFFESTDSINIYNMKKEKYPYVKTFSETIDHYLNGETGFKKLYSDASALAIVMQMLLQNGYYGDEQILNSNSVYKFIDYFNQTIMGEIIASIDTEKNSFVIFLNNGSSVDEPKKLIFSKVKNIILDEIK